MACERRKWEDVICPRTNGNISEVKFLLKRGGGGGDASSFRPMSIRFCYTRKREMSFVLELLVSLVLRRKEKMSFVLKLLIITNGL